LRSTAARAYDRVMKYMLVLAIAFGSACGSSSSPPAVDAAGGGSGSGAGSGFTLSINDYLAWCSVTEQGATYATSMTLPKGTVVNLDAMPASATFVWGYWTGTDGDTTAAHDTNMMTTVTMSADKSLVACCPFPPPASQTCP
jgi:hypothetical protein